MDKIGAKNLVVYAEQKRWLIVAWLQILGNCNTKYLRHPDSIFSTTQVHCELLSIFSSRCVHHIASWNFIIQMLLYSRRRKTLPDKASGPRSVRRAFKFLRPGWWVMHLALKKKKKKIIPLLLYPGTFTPNDTICNVGFTWEGFIPVVGSLLQEINENPAALLR